MEKPKINDLITNILIIIVCTCSIILCNQLFQNVKHINELSLLVKQQEKLSAARQGYLNRRIDLVDLAARDATITANSAWDQADKTRTDDSWMEGRTTEEIDSIWNDHAVNKTPLPE
jgi:hypothetical protein